MDPNLSPIPRADVHPYRGGSAHRRPPGSRASDVAVAGPILCVSCLLFGLCVLRVTCGLREEGWVFERWAALTIALVLGRSVCLQLFS